MTIKFTEGAKLVSTLPTFPVRSEPRTPVGLVNPPAKPHMADLRLAADSGPKGRTFCPSDPERGVADGAGLTPTRESQTIRRFNRPGNPVTVWTPPSRPVESREAVVSAASVNLTYQSAAALGEPTVRSR